MKCIIFDWYTKNCRDWSNSSFCYNFVLKFQFTTQQFLFVEGAKFGFGAKRIKYFSKIYYFSKALAIPIQYKLFL